MAASEKNLRAAEAFGVCRRILNADFSRATFYRWLQSGLIPSTAIPGPRLGHSGPASMRFVRIGDLLAFCAAVKKGD
jgi:hypothetical protein